MGGFAWVTLATNDSYSLGALVLAHSLKKANTAHKLVVLITPSVSQPMREQLQTVFDVVKLVEVLDSKDEAHLALLERPELGITFTKIHCWRLTEFDKCVFLDADTLVVRNCDELFEREELSAAPDFSWPDCFNSGVFVFKPSVETFDKILQFAVEKGSFDGGDQGLLNMFFSDWATQDIKKHLPFTYNLSSLAAYTYIPAFKQYGAETRIVHFIGTGKPWLQKLDPATKIISPTPGAEHLTPMLQRWWDLFCEHVHPHLNKNLDNCNGRLEPEPVEVCSNSVINDINDECLKPCNPEPYAPYREKDDYRQFNLPYQPFDVKGTSGELLNIEFLKASAAPSPPPPEIEEKKEEEVEQNVEKMEEKKTEEVEERMEKEEAEVKEEVIREEEKKVEEQQKIEEPPAPKGPFDYDTFFPDEKCVNNYLEQNVMTYQPFGHHSHHHKNDHQHQNHHHQQENQNQNQQQTHQETQKQHHQEVHHQETTHSHQHNQHYEHSHKPEEHYSNQNQEHHNWETQSHNQNNKSDSHHNVVLLPRFLTIPENDMRQSGNTVSENYTHEKPKSDHSNMVKEPSPPFQEFRETPPLPPPSHLEDKPPEKPELKKSKSMPQLDVTKIGTTLKPSVWQSQPNVSTDPKKYLMPKLKPLLPKTNSFNKTVPTSFSRVTLYTEFLMSSDYKEPLGLPKDKIGFVEMQILREAHLKRSKSEGNLKDKFGPLPYVEEGKRLTTPKKRPFNSLDHSELIDIRECKRQLGNKPKPKEEEKKEEVARPVVPKPTQVKKTGLFKKIKSRESMLFEKGKKKLNKKETKKAKENRAPKQELNGQTSSSLKKSNQQTETLKPAVNGISNNVEDILKKLKNFSKDYIHYFGDLRKKDKTIQKEQNVEKSGLNNNENKLEKRKFEEENRLVGYSTSEEEYKRDHLNGLGVENKTPKKLKEKVNDPKKMFDVKNYSKQNGREKEEMRESRELINELEKTAKAKKNVRNSIPQNGCYSKEVGNNETTLTLSLDKIEEEGNEKKDNGKTNLSIDNGRKVEEEIEKSKLSEKSENSLTVKNGECAGKEKPIEDVENLGKADKLNESVDVEFSKTVKVEEAHERDQTLGSNEKSEDSGFVDILEEIQNGVNHKSVGKVENVDMDAVSTPKGGKEVEETPEPSQKLGSSEKSGNSGLVGILEETRNGVNHKSVEKVKNVDMNVVNSSKRVVEGAPEPSEKLESSEKSENSGFVDILEKKQNEVNHKPVEKVEKVDVNSENSTKTGKVVEETPERGEALGISQKSKNSDFEGVLEKAQNEVNHKSVGKIQNVDMDTVSSPKGGKVVEETPEPSQKLGSSEKSENSGFVDILGKTRNEVNHKSVEKVESEDKEERVCKKEEEESESVEEGLNNPEESKISEKHSETDEAVESESVSSNIKSFELSCTSSEKDNQEKGQPLGNDVVEETEYLNSHLEPGTVSLEVGKRSENGVVDVRSRGNGEGGVVEDEKGEEQTVLESPVPSRSSIWNQRNHHRLSRNTSGVKTGKPETWTTWGKIRLITFGPKSAKRLKERRHHLTQNRNKYSQDLEVLPGSLPPSQSPSTETKKPGEGVAQPTVPKAEENVSAPTKTSDLEYIETLPSEPPVRSTEEDEIIFSKPEKGAPLLSNIKEEEDNKAGAPTVAAQSTPVGPAVTPMAAAPQTAMTPSTPQGAPAAPQPPMTPSTPQAAPAAPQSPMTPSTPQAAPAAPQPPMTPSTPQAAPTPPQPAMTPSTPQGAPAAPQPAMTPSTPQGAPAAPQPPMTPSTPQGAPAAPQPPMTPSTPQAAPPAPQPPMTPSTPQGAPAESKPKEAPSTDNKPTSNVETKTQMTAGSDNKVVAAPADQIKPQEPAPEIKTEVKTPDGSAAEKAKGSEKPEQVAIASTEPKPEVSSPGTPVAPQAPAPKETSSAKTSEEPKTEQKTENIQTPSTDPAKMVSTQPIELPQNVEALKLKTESKEDPAKQGVQTPEKEAGASGTAPIEERQVPPTPTITPPTPTTPTSMALMVIPKDSKSLVKLSDIIDPKKPVEEEQKVGPTAEPIPMPPIPEPESSEQKKTKSSPTPEPTDQPQKTTRSDSLKDNGKQKKGVFSKILEIVGVTPKEKKEGEGDSSNSVFYDVENAKEAISSPENVVEVKETPKEDLSKVTLEEPVAVAPEQEKAKEQEKAPEKAKEQEKAPEKAKEPEKAPEKPAEENKTVEKDKQGKSKAKSKPARNQKSGDTKGQPPLPKETEPPKQETTIVPAPTQQQNVVEPPSAESVTKEKVKSEIEDILGKAKSEAESRLQAADTEVKAEELINTMKLLVDDGKELPKVEQPDVEELKVTTPEERQKHKGEAAKSKLSDQILKAIPPPRRKAISDAKAETSSSTGAIPKTTTTPEAAPKEEQKPKEKPAEGGKGGKSPKPSAIPVPPPRNKPKPPQAAPPKGKGKK